MYLPPNIPRLPTCSETWKLGTSRSSGHPDRTQNRLTFSLLRRTPLTLTNMYFKRLGKDFS